MDENNDDIRAAPAVEGGAAADDRTSVAVRAKRLKSSEPDFEVTCKADGEEEKTFQCHSFSLAFQSKYFDSLLVSNMSEAESKKVTLEDVSPEVFELALEIVQDPVKTLAATPEEILKVVRFYDRFDFTSGLKVAETVLGKFIDGWIERQGQRNPKPTEMRMIIQVIKLSEESQGMEALVQKSKDFIKKSLAYDSSGHVAGIFTEDNVTAIQGFLASNEDCLEDFFRRFSRGTDAFPPLSTVDFPKILAGQIRLRSKGDDLLKTGVKLKCTFHVKWESGEDGVEFDEKSVILKARPSSFAGGVLFALEGHSEFEVWVFQDSDWSDEKMGKMYDCFDWYVLVRCQGSQESEQAEFAFPYSGHSHLPPTGEGWVSLFPGGDSATVSLVSIEPIWG